MSIQESEILISSLEEKLMTTKDFNEFKKIKEEIDKLKSESLKDLSAWDRVYLARHPKRPKAMDYINELFDGFIEMHGDQYFGDDKSIVGGIGYFNNIPVTIIAQCKGKTTEENLERNFGMTNPEGYRKALRLAHQAEKFNRPIITIVDTSGAYPGMGAEERGQAFAISQSLMEFSKLSVPTIALVISEGGSGGALALSVTNRILMLENAIYSILSPEGFASILWKDASRVQEAAAVMKLTANDLFEKNIVDYIVKEQKNNSKIEFEKIIKDIDKYISKELEVLIKMDTVSLIDERYKKFRNIGC